MLCVMCGRIMFGAEVLGDRPVCTEHTEEQYLAWLAGGGAEKLPILEADYCTVRRWCSQLMFNVQHYPPKRREYSSIYGIPKGGWIPAIILAGFFRIPCVTELKPDTLIVDDVVDTGTTARRYEDHDVVALIRKPWAEAPNVFYAAYDYAGWVNFFWEKESIC